MKGLKVFDLMTLNPVTVDPNSSLREVLAKLREDCIRQLPVVDETGRLVGIVTDRDVRLAMNSPFILHERWQDEALLDTMTAGACMTPDPITVTPETDAYIAAEMLCAYKFGALPVVGEKLLVGIISVSDFLELFIKSQRPEQVVMPE